MQTMNINIPELKDWANQHILEICHNLGFLPTDRGRYLTSCCPAPYHAGDANNDRAFVWSYDKQSWHCYTHHCEETTGYDIIGLVQMLKECSLGHALHILEEFKEKGFDPTIKVITKSIIGVKTYPINKEKLKILMPDEYFLKRGIDNTILKKHQVGYWQREGTFMNKRAIVPIFDDESNLVGYSGRTLLDETQIEAQKLSKWVHAKDFISDKMGHLDKSGILYNLNNCKGKIKESKTVYIVEGPVDCWKLEMSGIENVVATLGIYFTPAQIALLIKYNVENVVICYDNDANHAGQEAALRVKEQLNPFFHVIIKHPDKKDYGEMSIEDIKNAFK